MGEDKEVKKPAPFSMIQWITVMVSVLTLCYTCYSYIKSQEMADKRKYNNAFYDERYKVLKEITNSISQITNIVTYNGASTFSKDAMKDIRDKSAVFNYSYLVLNEKNGDSVLLNLIQDYDMALTCILTQTDTYTPSQLDSIQKAVIVKCGNILNNEKDSINSFKFSLF